MSNERSICWEKLCYKVKDGEDANTLKRCGHTLSLIGSNIYMFGGIGSSDSDSPSPTNEIHLLKLAHVENVDQVHEWSHIHCSSAHLPPGRWNHSATQISLMQLLVVGGESLENTLNDVWVFNCSTFTWHKKELRFQGNENQENKMKCLPMFRGNHTATLISDKVYLFGGIGGRDKWSRSYLNNLCSIDTENWTWAEVDSTGKPPAGRCGHQACTSDDKLIIFGGTDAKEQFRDIHIWNLSERTWTQIEDDLQLPRWNHSSYFDPDRSLIFTFGGMGSDDVHIADAMYNDVVIIDPLSEKALTFSSEQICGAPPTPRFGSAIIYDPRRPRFILFGGYDNRWCGDMHELVYTDHQLQPASTHEQQGDHYKA